VNVSGYYSFQHDCLQFKNGGKQIGIVNTVCMIQRLINKLKSHKKISVISHVRPDCDAIGSQVALCLWLKKNGIEAAAFNEDVPPPSISWMLDYFPVRQPDPKVLAESDAFVYLDGNSHERFGSAGNFVRNSGRPLYLIDHHPDPADYFDLAVSVVSASSTAELIYRIYEDTDLSLIDKPIAESLYAGMMTDTGSFRYDSVSAFTHRAVAGLIERGGFVPETVHARIFDLKKPKQLILLGMCLKRIRLHESNMIATISVTESMLEDTDSAYEDLEGIVNYPLTIAGVMASILMCEVEGRVKLSFRAKGEFNVNHWARNFDGGGHQKAAGAWHDGPLEKTLQDVLKAGREQLKSEPE
jgi:bifunctional oligoribonuclease and PAP phosphatase NrnA